MPSRRVNLQTLQKISLTCFRYAAIASSTKANDLNGQLAHLKREELQRIQSHTGSIKVSMVYLTMVQEAQNVVTYASNLLKVSRKFVQEAQNVVTYASNLLKVSRKFQAEE